MQNVTPMMRQYFELKEQHKDHILFFRLGDFYEMFFDDALLASKELELTLTGRDCGMEERAPMCGVPHHSAEGYIAKLINKGYKVAMCEQVEDPATAQGVVKREVVRVITPGTLMENNLLEEETNNFLCCIYLTKKECGLAFADISTGEVNVIQLDNNKDSSIINELSRFTPRELVFNTELLSRNEVANFLREKLFCTADVLPDAVFEYAEATATVLQQFKKKDLTKLGLDHYPVATCALGGLISYLKETQKTGLERLITINILEEDRFMNLDMSARTNLELVETIRTGEKRGSLLWVLDQTKTPMGKRLIRNYINQPLVNPAEITKRLNAVDELFKDEFLCGEIAEALSGIFDVERLITRIVYGSANPREYKALEQAVRAFPALKELLVSFTSQKLSAIHDAIDTLPDMVAILHDSIKEEPPVTLSEGGVIADGYYADLDELRELVTGARNFLTKMEVQERERTGIRNLKIGYNRVFGYYLEVTKSYLDQVPEEYIRKQTLANSERYITEELKDLEDKILTANDKIVALEQELFEEIRQKIIVMLARLQGSATAIAEVDVLQSFAMVSLQNQYVRPTVNLSDAIHIKQGRHPVVERMLNNAPFVPNDVTLDNEDNQVAIITGPNMAGKSTYMRQTALIVLMAQIGCFVPAESATLGIVDGIYTRIGASDDLTAGQSTFMVEMNEVASILHNATSKSLLILDEIGRGTSTYDGMSIAQAVIEYIADPKKLGAKTMFATHYHELTEMEDFITGVKNYNIAAKKRGDDIIFLRRIVPGGTDDSYGIEVSKLAGVPSWITNRSFEILKELEGGNSAMPEKRTKEPSQDMLFQTTLSTPSAIEEQLELLDIETVTPIEALNILYDLKDQLPE